MFCDTTHKSSTSQQHKERARCAAKRKPPRSDLDDPDDPDDDFNRRKPSTLGRIIATGPKTKDRSL